MSRFNNLEFGNESEDHARSLPGARNEERYLGEAETAYAAGRFEGALRAFSKALEFNPQNAAAWTGQVRALIEMGEYREAKLWADKALEHFPNEAELLAAKAVALGRAGDLKAALAFSDASVEERGDTPYIWLARGDVLLACREHRANFCLEKALAMAPKDWLIAWLVARIRYYYREFSLALKIAQQALTLDASRAVLWLQVGQCQKALGLLWQAELSFEQARQLDRNCHEAHVALGELSRSGFWPRLIARARGWLAPR